MEIFTFCFIYFSQTILAYLVSGLYIMLQLITKTVFKWTQKLTHYSLLCNN